MKIVSGQIRPKDRDYNRKGKKREEWFEGRKDELSNALLTGQMKNLIMEVETMRIRKLTPKECFRLMGFDDKDLENAEKVNSNSQLYKQAGNSIVVDVLEEIFCQIFDENGEIYV